VGPLCPCPFARPRPHFRGRGTARVGGRGAAAERSIVSKKLYVGNLAFGTTSEDLNALFAQYGSVTSAQIVTDRETGRSRGFAFVEMGSGAEEAIRALNLSEFQGRNLTVNEAKPREDRPRSGGGGGGYGGGGGGGGGRGGYGGGRRY
jgi:cold-inducible RNA-binding protein